MASGVGQARAAQIGDVFVIPLENHDFTQPSSYTSVQQINGNTAAPYINSLITPGNPNATDVSYATNYTNSGTGVHPSEPNYIWSEAGTNYNSATNTTITSDNDPTAGNKNIFTSPHLTGLMNAAGVSWKNYQEDYQISGKGALVTANGTLPGGATNPYNGSTQYSYAPKHDPMAFFSDTATQNLYPISQLATDLSQNTVGKYNWITPDLYNDMHTALNAGFTYHGTHYTGDQAAVAQGDNFLSIVVPEIEASAAFQDNGVIIIWSDETEGGDTTAYTSTEIVISPLAKGNAYASSVALNHSSDLKTMQEIFNLGPSYLNSTIPTSEYSPAGGPGTYNTVSGSNDLSDLFQAGAIPSGIPPVWLGGVGNWNDSTKWNNARVPNDPSLEVHIDSGNPTASVVTLNQNAGIADLTLDANDSLMINSGNTLTLNGPGTTTLNGSVTNSGILTLTGGSVTNAGTFTQSTGSLNMAGNFSNSGSATIGGTQSWSSGTAFTNAAGSTTFNTDTGSATSSPLSISVIGGTVTFGSTQHLASLSINSGAMVTASAATLHSVIVTGALALTGLFDLTNNDLIVQGNSIGAAATNLEAISIALKSGFNASAGYWNGTTGIVSSQAFGDATELTTLGFGPSSGGLFDGVNTTSNDVLVKYTYYGDANLDGTVNGADYQQIDNGFGLGLTGWYNGDFNYDGVVDGSDYSLIDNTFNQINATGASPLAITAAPADLSVVPEPSTLALLTLAMIGVLSSRRRRDAETL